MWFSKHKYSDNGFDIDISISAEDTDPTGCFEFDSEKEKEKFITELYRRLEHEGDLWAWCSVKVEIAFMGFTGASVLGCINADSLESFMGDGSFDDALIEARTDCLRNVEFAVERGNEAKLAREAFPK